MRVLVIGAGGHARVVVETLRDDSFLDLIGAVSDDGSCIAGFDLAMLGRDDDLERIAADHSVDAACVAIGDNAARERVARRWLELGRPLRGGASRHAVVSPTATVGDGAVVFPGAIVNPATTIGRGAIVNTNASVDHDSDIGEFVHIAPGCALAGGVRIGARTLVGIGARVLPGVSVGCDAVIGAGAVVIGDVPDGVTVVGIPARVVQRRGTTGSTSGRAR